MTIGAAILSCILCFKHGRIEGYNDGYNEGFKVGNKNNKDDENENI